MNSQQHRSISLFSRITLLLVVVSAIPLNHAAAQSAQAPTPSFTNSNTQALADSGDSGAQFRLAKSILAHNPSPNDIQSALTYLRESAAQNNPNAQFYLGYLYEHGQFVPKDYSLAFQNYEAATHVHYPPAENNLASLYQHGQGVPKSASKAFDWYLAAAQHGDPVGQLNLASIYYSGDNVPRDYAQAVHWLRLSADAGLPESESVLAYFYFYGVAIQTDYTEAARLVRLAAQKNLPGAQTSLGYLYELGKGVPLDYVAAYTWYSRAAAAGDRPGADRRKHLAHVMTPKQLDQANAQVAASAPPSQSVPQSTSPITATNATSASFSLINH